MELKNKRIVITGATSGIGQQLMFALSKYEGVKIIAVGRRMRNIPIAMNIIPFKADISNHQEICTLFDFAVEKLGGIDIFIANAGDTNFEAQENTTCSDVEQLFKTNVFSAIYATKRMFDLHKESNDEFFIAITVSCTAKLPVPGNPLCVSSKSALDGFINSVKYKMPKNGHIAGIYPMGVKNVNLFEEMMGNNQKKDLMPGKTQTTKEVANAIIKGIKQNKKTIYTAPFTRIILFIFQTFPFILNLYSKRLYKKQTKQR